MKPHDNQIVTTLLDPSYGFDNKGPSYWTSHAGTFMRSVEVDPAPCYPHDEGLVKHELAYLRDVAPLPVPLAIFLLGHDFSGRTNGQHEDTHYYADNVSHPVSIITLCAKRIPIHPAMTRYLVAHEYGHAVNQQLCRNRPSAKPNNRWMQDAEFDEWYTTAIRPDAKRSYGCGHWHANVSELIANDFRILIAQREAEFWPHPGFARPEAIPACVDFWKSAAEELRKES